MSDPEITPQRNDAPSESELRQALPIYKNWWLPSSEKLETVEYPLLTDCDLTGELLTGGGPHQVLNLVPENAEISPSRLEESALLRIEWRFFLDFGADKDGGTVDEFYHGGDLQDEFSALLSLVLGRRIRALGESMRIEEGDDPFRRPQMPRSSKRNSAYVSFPERPIIPQSFDKVSLGSHPILARFPLLPVLTANLLIKAARLYQEALWIAEADPNMAWLLFVSSIETAANCGKTYEGAAEERLRESDLGPKITTFLQKYGAQDGFSEFASLISGTLGAGKKFRGFISAHLPEPPSRRPGAAFQVDWSPESLEKSLGKIYAYRSKALHTGKPFPAPLTASPDKDGEHVYCEKPCPDPITVNPDKDGKDVDCKKPRQLAVMTRNARWVGKDLPMYLHVFEHLVRGALLNWWATTPTVFSSGALAIGVKRDAIGHLYAQTLRINRAALVRISPPLVTKSVAKGSETMSEPTELPSQKPTARAELSSIYPPISIVGGLHLRPYSYHLK